MAVFLSSILQSAGMIRLELQQPVMACRAARGAVVRGAHVHGIICMPGKADGVQQMHAPTTSTHFCTDAPAAALRSAQTHHQHPICPYLDMYSSWTELVGDRLGCHGWVVSMHLLRVPPDSRIELALKRWSAASQGVVLCGIGAELS